MHLTDLEFWVRPRAPFVRGLRLQVGDDWQARCSHAVYSLLQSCVHLQTLHFLVQGRWGWHMTSFVLHMGLFIAAYANLINNTCWLDIVALSY